MKQDRQYLEEAIRSKIDSFKNSRHEVYKFNQIISQIHLPVGILESIIIGEIDLSTIESTYLYGLTKALYVYSSQESFDPLKFFSEREIRDYNNILETKPLEEKMSLPIEFTNVIKVKYDSYVTTISIQDLVKMSKSQLIQYDYESQRGATYKLNNSGGIVKTPILNKSSVKRISQNMANETYFEDMITLNAYSKEVDPIYYDEKNLTLTINEGVTISIVDGFHRLQGSITALELNPNVDLNLILSIRTYDPETAQKYFGQINTINVLKKERRNELTSEKLSDNVVTNLQRKSELKKKIASSSTISEIANELTTFDIMSFAIDQVFDLKTRLDVIKVSDYLVEFFDYLVGNYVEEFSTNINKYRSTNINHPLIFIGYIVIAKHMYDNEISLQKIKTYVDSIVLKDDELDKLLNAKKSLSANKRIRIALIKYFESHIRGVK
ncbi:DNA sulfur modification protein DndB [Paenibacillus illinoisensis]|uniref:DGQHR domain protein n=1 Tax=Paenibacillus illinoisensis TaxID=59845 RepID=A0A2W0C8B9_9BACL|nr:DNA sulfur modification protein DndB [Paenibacillus illinoisensis]PYY28287.1 Uncharacterized protein PIL02S_03438 [Paenibacillus illinoisensis]